MSANLQVRNCAAAWEERFTTVHNIAGTIAAGMGAFFLIGKIEGFAVKFFSDGLFTTVFAIITCSHNFVAVMLVAAGVSLVAYLATKVCSLLQGRCLAPPQLERPLLEEAVQWLSSGCP